MNIIIISPTLNHGGAERVASLWAEGFVERGHQVFFIANIEENEIYTLDKRIHLLPLANQKENKIIRYLGAIKLLRKYYETYHPDIIIGVMYACSLLAKIAELGLNIPIINTEHSAFERPSKYPLTSIDKFAKYWLNYLYDGTTVLTKADKDVIGKRFKKVFVLPNPTFLQPLSQVPEKRNIFLAAGRVDGWYIKGFDILLQAWSKIISNEQLEISNYDYSQDGKPSHWWLKIAGDGNKESFEYLMNLLPDAEWVFNNNVNDNDNKSAVWRSDKYRIEFLGFRKDIEELYKKSSVFVLSSRYEGFGMVLIEAMSQGCAPIACDYKGRQREILNPSSALPEGEGEPNRKIEITEDGILCEPDDLEALASALEKMTKDDDYRQRAQANAILCSQDFTKDKIIDKWDLIIKRYV